MQKGLNREQSGKPSPLSNENVMKTVREFDLPKPGWLDQPFKNWSNPLKKWNIPKSLETGVSWGNPLKDWNIPKFLKNGVSWDDPTNNWTPPDWIQNPLGGKDSSGPLIPGFQPEKGDWVPGDGPVFQNGSRENRAKQNRSTEITVDVTPQVSLDSGNLERALSNALGSGFVKDVADEIRRDVTNQLNL